MAIVRTAEKQKSAKLTVGWVEWEGQVAVCLQAHSQTRTNSDRESKIELVTNGGCCSLSMESLCCKWSLDEKRLRRDKKFRMGISKESVQESNPVNIQIQNTTNSSFFKNNIQYLLESGKDCVLAASRGPPCVLSRCLASHASVEATIMVRIWSGVRKFKEWIDIFAFSFA